MKLEMLAAQVVALLAWMYLRRCAPVERFWLDNMYLLGHLLVVLGLFGWALLRTVPLIAFGAAAAVVAYNFLRYRREYRAYTHLPVEVRDHQATAASPVNQRLVAAAGWIGAVLLMTWTTQAGERDLSHLTFLTLVPGLGGAIAALSEAYHRRRRARALR